jgi:lipid-binding SYLF domain-containing protein
MKNIVSCFAFLVTAFSLLVVPCSAQSREDRTVQEANTVLNEIIAIPNDGIPREMLNNAHAVAIIPRVIKGSFVVGARHGNGVLLVRDTTGAWHAPVFVELTGGNIGWQVGVQSTDIVLVFKTPQSVSGLLNGKFTIGADAAVAAGPVGRQAGAATDSRLNAEIFSYSRSRGLFAGVALDGSVIKVESDRNAAYYQPVVAGGPVTVPQAAQQLATTLLQYSGTYTGPKPLAADAGTQPAAQAASGATTPARPAGFTQDQVSAARDNLARSSRELNTQLPAEWQTYLAFPSEVYQGNGNASPEQLKAALERFSAVRQDPRYTSLANNPKFQATYSQLQQYSQLISQTSGTINLPPPPGSPPRE